MRISTSWLQEYVEPPAPEQLNHVFEMAGIGVENFDSEAGIWTLEVTSNRGDWLSAVGLSREIAAMTGQRFRVAREDDQSTPAPDGVAVEIEYSEDCARYVAQLIEGVSVHDSPEWVQQRLLECGMRPVNNIVDATNLVMLETGQPLHAFDADKVRGARIVVRRARPGETLVTLDEVERKLSDEVLVIADAEQPLAVAGVMGGLDSEVTASTTRVLLESAHFAPQRVRRSARVLELTSEASRRFARWVDPNGVLRGAHRASQLIAEFSGGKVLPGAVDNYPAPVGPARVSIRVARCNAVLGVELTAQAIGDLLKRLGFKLETSAGGMLQFSIPTWRRDIEREIDLIEEVARMNGYDKVPTTLPTTVNAAAGRSLSQRLEERARGVLLRCGLDEVLTYSLENQAAVSRAGLTENDGLSTPAVALRNPLSDDYTQLRTSLIPSLLETLKVNAGASSPVRVFEIGKVYLPQSGKAQPDERIRIGLALLATTPEAHWDKEQAPAPVDFFTLKALVQQVLEGLGAPRPSFRATQNSPFHPGRAAALSIDGEDLGLLGEIHPDIAERYELRHRAYLAVIDFEALIRHIALVSQYSSFSKLPSADRDIALVVPEATTAAAVENSIHRAAGALLESARIFDLYRGSSIEPGFKSVAVALRFRSAERTLQEDEVEQAMSAIRESASRDLGAHLRA